MQLTGFEGRVALVTGAAGGIGTALVKLLVATGCQVVATDRESPAIVGERVGVASRSTASKSAERACTTARRLVSAARRAARFFSARRDFCFAVFLAR